MTPNEARSLSHSTDTMTSPNIPMPAATASFSPAAPPTKKSIPQELPVLTSDHPQTQEKPSAADGEGNETEEALIERLGRERPAIFKSRWAEIFFCCSILASQLMAVSLPSLIQLTET